MNNLVSMNRPLFFIAYLNAETPVNIIMLPHVSYHHHLSPQERDRGWYNCKVIHLNRHPGQEAQDNVSYISLKLQFVMIGWLQ